MDSLTEKTELLSLPPELLQEVWNFLDKKSLKALRSTSRLCNKWSTPQLFRDFAIYPHVRSFERFINVSSSPGLAVFVQSIHYNTRFLRLTDMILRRLESVYSKDISEEERRIVTERALKLHKQNLQAENPMDDITQVIYFQRAFPSLPNLASITVQDALPSTYEHLHSPRDGGLPHFYSQIVDETCGRFEHTRLEQGMWGQPRCRSTYSRAVLMTLHCLPRHLDNLKLVGLRWGPFLLQGDFAKHEAYFRSTFANLKSLQLKAPSRDPKFPLPLTFCNLQAILKEMVQLQSLTISFQSLDSIEVIGQHMEDLTSGRACRSFFAARRSDITATPARLSWSPKLRHLKLSGLVCTSKEVKSILKHCSKSLVSLKLGGLILVPEEPEGPRACLVDLFKWMRRHLKLEKFGLGGAFTNGGMQDWFVNKWADADPDNTRLRTKLRDYVLNGGECPLDHVCIAPGFYDVHKKSHMHEVPSTLKEGGFGGDETWEMSYNDDVDSGDEIGDEDESDSELDSLLDGPFGPYDYDPGEFEDEDDESTTDEDDDTWPDLPVGQLPHNW
ncbi:hypothetical protein LTS08_006975 [Lithohypha guttulata]|uniref:F-box domain-containing protein n=1 Tax=Lithohypha guttulata TaxID=1690604 RepID=A0AAN7YJD5_9EURO|nr:hypothetical protein LTR51_002025 [Lithohypha guttulata]KAK5090243.1 hypothetical protein LTR05_000414 [Lithohypha guttulata]KAK5097561.1 hypothetical protein LTS08_006975 [Lithohypha guttulata]